MRSRAAAVSLMICAACSSCRSPVSAAGAPPDHGAAQQQPTHLGVLLDGPQVSLAPTSAGRSEEDRGRAQSLVVEAMRRREAGDLPGAQADLKQALHSDPSLASAHVEWAVTAEALGGDTALVGAHLKLGARLAPENPRFQLLAASWAAQHGAYDISLEFFDRAIAADPRNVEAHTRKADLLMLRGDAALAILSYREALALDAVSVPSWTGLAAAGELATRPEVAEEAHRALVALFPDATIYRAKLVAFYRRTSQEGKAAAAQREIEKLDPRDPRKLRKLRR